MLDINSIYKLSNSYILRAINEKYWALSIEDGTQLRLNESSFYILNLLNKDMSIKDIISDLLDNYDVEEKTLCEDLGALIDISLKLKLIYKER